MSIAASFVWQLEADSKQLNDAVDKSTEKVEGLNDSIEKTSKSTKAQGETHKATTAKVSKGTGVMAAGYGKLFGAIAAVVSIGKAFGMAHQFAEDTRALGALAKQTGIYIGDLDGLTKGLSRLGVNADETKQALVSITTAMGQDSKALSEWGIQVYDSSGKMRDTLDVFGDIAEMSKDMDAQNSAAFFKSLRITDPNLIENIKKGRTELENLVKAEKRKGVADQEQLDISNKYLEASTNLKTELGDIAEDLSKKLLPVLTEFANKTMEAIEWGKEYTKFLKILGVVITGALIPGLIKMTSALVVPAAIIAGIAAVALVIDAVSAAIEGNVSVLDEMLEEYPKIKEFVDPIIKWLAEKWLWLVDIWNSTDFEKWGNNIMDVLIAVKDAFANAFNSIKDLIMTFFNFYAGIITKIIDKFKSINDVVGKVGGFIRDSLGFGDSNINVNTTTTAVAADAMNGARSASTNGISTSSILNNRNTNQTNNNNQTNNITINTTADPKAISSELKSTNRDLANEFARQNRGGALN